MEADKEDVAGEREGEQERRMKTCSKCKIDKSREDFHKNRSYKDGLHYRCKLCRILRQRNDIINNKEYVRQYYIKNKERISSYQKKYRQENKEKLRQRDKEYAQSRKDKTNEYWRMRSKSDLQYKLKSNLRSRLYCAIKGSIKNGSAVRDLGCSTFDFKSYLESLFQKDMSWENYGYDGWHIDHILPLSSFDLSDPEQLKKVCHYTNLQPLWAKDNIRKGGIRG